MGRILAGVSLEQRLLLIDLRVCARVYSLMIRQTVYLKFRSQGTYRCRRVLHQVK